MSDLKGKAGIKAFLLARIGEVVTTEQIRDASGGQGPYGRRLRELRDEEWWRIASHNDTPNLKPGEYRLIELPPENPPVKFARGISAKTRALVLERNGFTCQMCGIGKRIKVARLVYISDISWQNRKVGQILLKICEPYALYAIRVLPTSRWHRQVGNSSLPRFARQTEKIRKWRFNGYLKNWGAKMTKKTEKKLIIEVKSHRYQPSKAELMADVCITTTPENLAKNVLRQVTVRETEDA